MHGVVGGLALRKIAGLAVVLVAIVAMACSNNFGPDSSEPREISAFEAAAEAISESVSEDGSEGSFEDDFQGRAQSSESLIRDPLPPGNGEPLDVVGEGSAAGSSSTESVRSNAAGSDDASADDASTDDPSTDDPAPDETAANDAEVDSAIAVSEERTPVSAADESIKEAGDPSYTIILDAGHGGTDTGAIANRVVERESNLDFARRVEEILVAQGHRVVQTRVDGGRSVLYPDDETIPQIAESRIDLQARVDLANQEGGDVFVSLHSNLAKDNVFERGVEVWFDPNRPHSGANFRLSVNLLSQVIAELFEFGYPVFNRQVHSDECHSVEPGLNICLPLFVLGPPATLERFRVVAAGIDPDRFAFAAGEEVLMTRATEMPAALVELLVVSNPSDAAILRSNEARQAIARGVARAILEFLEGEELKGDAGETQSDSIVSDEAALTG